MKNRIIEQEEIQRDYHKEAELPEIEKPLTKKQILEKYNPDKKTKTKKVEDEYEYQPQWKISKKLIKDFEEEYLRLKWGWFLTLIPVMLVWFIALFNLFTHMIPFEDMWKEWKIVFFASIILSLFLYSICYYNTLKAKRLYTQLCNWTITTKEVEIIRFERYGSYSYYDEDGYRGDYTNRNSYLNRQNRHNAWFIVVASDWKRKYESEKFSDEILKLDYSQFYRELETYAFFRRFRIYRFLKLVRIIREPQAAPRKELTIYKRKYSIGDKLTVYIDSKWKWNYCLYIPEN